MSAVSVRALAVAGCLPLLAMTAQNPPAAQSPRIRPTTLSFIIGDSTLQGPATIAAGHVLLRAHNRAGAPHQVALIRLAQGVEPAAVLSAMRDARQVPLEQGLTGAGGIGPLPPGDSGSVLMRLLPGRYVVYCTLNRPDGNPYFRHGMAMVLEATGPGVTQQPTATALSAVVLTDAVMNFAQTVRRGERRVPMAGLSRGTRLVRGRHVIQVDNYGSQGHAIVILRTGDLRAMSAYVAWLDGRTGTVPAVVTGIPNVPVGGQTEFLYVNLEAGAYTVFCPNHHARTGMRGFQTGEFTQFIVS